MISPVIVSRLTATFSYVAKRGYNVSKHGATWLKHIQNSRAVLHNVGATWYNMAHCGCNVVKRDETWRERATLFCSVQTVFDTLRYILASLQHRTSATLCHAVYILWCIVPRSATCRTWNSDRVSSMWRQHGMWSKLANKVRRVGQKRSTTARPIRDTLAGALDQKVTCGNVRHYFGSVCTCSSPKLCYKKEITLLRILDLFVTHAAGAAAYCTHPPVLMPRERRHDLFVDYTVVWIDIKL